MAEKHKLMAILAHPDDESLGIGGTLTKYAVEGVETYLLTATRGERGWTGPTDEDPGPEALGTLREAELLAAAKVLGIHEVSLLNYIDGDLDQAEPTQAIAQIVAHVRQVRPQVVVTFGSDGAYGHPDHIAISQFTTAAILRAADASYESEGGLAPHSVSKLYHMVLSKALDEAYTVAFGKLVMTIDGAIRTNVVWQDWAITTWLDTTAHWRTVLEAVSCHRTQVRNYGALAQLPEAQQHILWGLQAYYRVFSLVNSGRAIEHDLFEGL